MLICNLETCTSADGPAPKEVLQGPGLLGIGRNSKPPDCAVRSGGKFKVEGLFFTFSLAKV